MVRNYKRKTEQNTLWTPEIMQAAVTDIRSNQISLRQAEQTYGIPHATIRRHLMKTVKTPGKLGRFRCTLNEEYETELLQYIIDMQQRFYGSSLTDVRQLAFQFAERNNIDVPFSKVTQLAGKDWTSGFLRRHQKETSAASSTSRPMTTASDHAEIPKRKASNRISQAETSIATKEQSLSMHTPMRTSRNPP